MTATIQVPFEEAYAGPIKLSPLWRPGAQFEDVESGLRETLASCLYGNVPKPPVELMVSRKPLSASGAERLVLTMALPEGKFTVDAALWLPTGHGPWPLVCGLDFVGPAGILPDCDFPLDKHSIVSPRPEFGMHDGRLTDFVRGTSAPSWPIQMITERGYAVLVSCYGSWTPDDTTMWQRHGIKSLVSTQAGAVSLWAWAYSCLIDAAQQIPEIDLAQVVVAGHSRLGKAALWAAANDPRISATFASSSGAAGAAPSSHLVGETLFQLQDRFPHWLKQDAELDFASVDQHALLALAQPGYLYLAAAEEDLWADPIGSYLALRAASEAWPDVDQLKWVDPSVLWKPGGQIINGPLGYHLRGGGHALLPYDWRCFLDFLAKVH